MTPRRGHRTDGQPVPAISAARCGSRLSTTQRYLNPVTEDVAGVLAFHARQRDRDPAATPAVGHILALRRRGDDYDPRPPYWNDLARNR